MTIEPYAAHHLDAIVALSLRAWEPVFRSIGETMPPEVYANFYPNGWQTSQQEDVTAVCNADDTHVWVAIEKDSIAGFVAVKLDADSKLGEIYMVAVDPAHQGAGIGLALNEFALDWMRDAGMTIAMVETGADPGHGPARRTYEKAGFNQWPVARYFKKL